MMFMTIAREHHTSVTILADELYSQFINTQALNSLGQYITVVWKCNIHTT